MHLLADERRMWKGWHMGDPATRRLPPARLAWGLPLRFTQTPPKGHAMVGKKLYPLLLKRLFA